MVVFVDVLFKNLVSTNLYVVIVYVRGFIILFFSLLFNIKKSPFYNKPHFINNLYGESMFGELASVLYISKY